MLRYFDNKEVYYNADDPNIILKIVNADNLYEVEFQNIAADLGHAPKIIDSFVSNGNLYIYMERIHGTCLADLPKISKELWNCIRYIVYELYEYGIEYIDINPFNFIVDNNERLWVIDFGHARKIENKKDWFVEEFLDGTDGWHPDF